jgi:RimJ/RimL family protein N-acetyltransferase
MSSHEPEGEIVTGPLAIDPSTLPQSLVLGLNNSSLSHGITLRRLILSDAQDLYTNLCGPKDGHLYKYISGGPFPDLKFFIAHLKSLIESPIFLPFSIFSSDNSHLSNQSPNTSKKSEHRNEKGTAISIICLMNIVPTHRSIEIGHVLFCRSLQRTAAASASIYLLMKFCFKDLHYQRVEWKCNNRNEPSRRAALRLGFKYEGTFRKHMVVKGKRRDSDWFSVLDDEWNDGVGESLEVWLGKENFDEKGKQRRKLEEIRSEVEK